MTCPATVLKGFCRQRPARGEGYGLSRAPVLVIRAVLRLTTTRTVSQGDFTIGILLRVN